MAELKSPISRNIDKIARQIYTKGSAKNINDDIISIVMLYYMSKSKEHIDIDNILDICDTHKDFFIEEIHAVQEARECYAKDDEHRAHIRLNESISRLTDLQTAIGVYYYNLYDGYSFYKRDNAVSLFQRAVLYKNPVAQFYLGTYYTTTVNDLSQYNTGIRLQRLFMKSTEDIIIKEANYRKEVADIIGSTFYKHEEFALLDFAIDCAQKNVNDISKHLGDIQCEKDRLRLYAVEKVTNAIDYVRSLSDFKIESFYNDHVFSAYSY